MKQFPTLSLLKGATSVVNINLTEFDMQGGYVLLLVKRKGGDVIREWRFDEPGEHKVVFEDELTATLEIGTRHYEYEIMWHLNGERFAQCAPSPVEVSRTLGGYPHGAES